MLIVDASAIYETLVGTPTGERVAARLAVDPDHLAPELVDAEVASIIRRDLMLARLDRTAADQAVVDLQLWPAERWGHRDLLPRVWALRENVRSWDAFYVALAEALQAPLITCDRRLGSVSGLRCSIEVIR